MTPDNKTTSCHPFCTTCNCIPCRCFIQRNPPDLSTLFPATKDTTTLENLINQVSREITAIFDEQKSSELTPEIKELLCVYRWLRKVQKNDS